MFRRWLQAREVMGVIREIIAASRDLYDFRRRVVRAAQEGDLDGAWILAKRSDDTVRRFLRR